MWPPTHASTWKAKCISEPTAVSQFVIFLLFCARKMNQWLDTIGKDPGNRIIFSAFASGNNKAEASFLGLKYESLRATLKNAGYFVWCRQGGLKGFFPVFLEIHTAVSQFFPGKSFLCLAEEAWGRLLEGWRWNISHCKRPLQCLLQKKSLETLVQSIIPAY